jgi:hypothetical protein
MNRSWAPTLALCSLVPLMASLGCDALTVRPFAGTVMQFTLTGAAVTPPGQHLELWARDQYNDIIRINPFYDFANGKTSLGLMIRQAISLDDPCITDDKGNLLTSAAAYPTSITQNGIVQTPQEQAQQIIDRINQLQHSIIGGGPLLGVLPYDPTPPPPSTLATDPTVTADQRLKACNDYRGASELTYVPNPLQLTAPGAPGTSSHGAIYGFAQFITITPPQNYNGFRLDTPINLKGVQEIFFTVEGNTVDPTNRGPLYLISTLTPGGREVVHFDLTAPNGGVSGAAALYVNLNEDPVQF